MFKASEVINKDLEKKAGNKDFMAALEPIDDINNFKLPEITEEKPAVVLDYNKKDDNIKVGYMSKLVEDNDLVDVAADFYFHRDGVKFDTAEEAVKYWMTDRTWKQTNTVSMTKELMFVTEDDQNLKQLANLKYLTEKWNEQPMFFRGAFETVYQNVSRALVDPLNLVGGLLYGQFAKAAGKKAFQKILSDQIKKQTAKKVSVGEASIEASKAANKAKLIGAVEGGFKVAGIDAALMGTADIVIQNTEKQLGMREALDPFRVGTAAVTGGVFSFASTAGVAYSLSKIGTGSQTKLPKSIKDSLPKPAKEGISITEENNMLQQVNQRTVLKKIADPVQLYGFNKFHEVDNLTKIGTGTGADVFSLKQAIKEAKVGDTDPSLLPAFRFRDTLASSARTKEFLEYKLFLPPDKNAVVGKANYRDTGIDGLNVVLKPLADLNEASDFMVYVGAKRAMDIYNHLAKQKVPLKKINLPFTKEQAKKIIDYGELDPKIYKQKYNEDSFKTGGDYKFYLNDLKKFTDGMLDYSLGSDLLDAAGKNNILKVYKNGYAPFVTSREISETFKQTEKLLQTPGKTRKGAIIAPSAPVKKLLKGTKFVDLDFYNTLVNYSYRVVQGADFNRANLSLVDMLTDMQTSGKFGTVVGDTGVLKKLNPKVVSGQAITTSVENSLNKLGLRITRMPGAAKKELPDAIDVANFAPITRHPGIEGSVLTVYRKGKPEFYEIRNPYLKAMYETYGVKATDTLTKYAENPLLNFAAKAINIPARILGRAITLDPLFQTANLQRDTLSGFINSAFSGVIDPRLPKGKQLKLLEKRGFLPVVDTAKGVAMQMPILKKLLKAQDSYRLAIINGMGMSTRTETGLLIPPNLAAKINNLQADDAKSYLDDLQTVLKTSATSGFTRYADFVSKFEFATRMGEFAMAKKAGWSDIAASYAGREVATDFGLHGASSKLNWLSSNTIFLNAGLQGFNKGFRRIFIESGKKPGQKGITNDARSKAAALVMATVVAPKVYLYFKNREYREYDEEKDIFKQLNLMVPYEDEDGNLKRFVKFPMPYDYGVFGNIAEATFEYFDKRTSAEAFKYLTESFYLVMPFNSHTLIPIPTTLEFFIESLINRDIFTGAKIKEEYLNSKSSDLHITPRTRDISIQISNYLAFLQSFGKDPDKVQDRKFGFVKTDPITIDFILSNFMVGIYRYPLEALDAMARNVDKYGERETLKKDEIDILRAPWNLLLKRNIQELPADSTTHTEIFFQLISRAEKVLSKNPERIDITDGYKVFDQLIEGIFSEKIQYGGKEIELYKALSPQLNVAKKLIDKARDKMELIKMDKSMSADRKREELDKVQQQINDVTYELITTIANSNLKEILEDIKGRSIFAPNPNIKN